MEIFHASKEIIKNPKIIEGFRTKYFGFGFYCTNIFKQAEKWAIRFNSDGFVNEYTYNPTDNLKIKNFVDIDTEWIEFVMKCRSGMNHNFDIVEGAMANDTVYNYIQDFQDKKISLSALLELIKFKKPTHQITFCSNIALQTIKFKKSYFIKNDIC